MYGRIRESDIVRIYILETDIVRTEIRNTREWKKRNVRMYVQDEITIWKANKQ